MERDGNDAALQKVGDIMVRDGNDATLQKVGDIYQYYIAAADCFLLQKGEELHIETHGDITIISKDNSFQKEVKHHSNGQNLTAKDIDFWKTFKNWVVRYEKFKSFKKLVLYTTSKASPNSVFDKWNSFTSKEKYDKLDEIGKKKTKNNDEEIISEINTIHKFIFKDNDESKVIELLNIIEIETCQSDIINIYPVFDQYISFIEQENRRGFIDALLGHVIAKIKDSNYIWKITKEEFDKIVQSLTTQYAGDNPPISNTYLNKKPNDNERSIYQDSVFVQAIKDISYDEKINDAINDFWRMSSTLIDYYTDDPIRADNILDYKNELTQVLKVDKSIIRLEQKSEDNLIRMSQIFFAKSINRDIINIRGFSRNERFFQKGVIHDIVNDKKIIWHIGVDEDEY